MLLPLMIRRIISFSLFISSVETRDIVRYILIDKKNMMTQVAEI